MSLESLPYELLLQVLNSLTNLTSLDSLLRASPASYRLFSDGTLCAVEIFESILAKGALCQHIQILIRQIAVLRSGARPFPPGYTEYTTARAPPGIASFRRQVVEESLRHSSRHEASRIGFVPRQLDRHTPAAVLRSLLVTARCITIVAGDCLDFYFDNLKEFATAGYTSNDPNTECKTKRLHVRPRAAWTEEQRCARTLWRMQLIFDLKQAARNKTLGWPRREIESLADISAFGPPEDDWWLELQVSSFSQHWPAAGCGERFFYHAAAHHDCYHPDVAHPEKHEHATVMEYVCHVHGHAFAMRANRGVVPLGALAGDREVGRRGDDVAEPRRADREAMMGASTAMQHYESARPAAGTCAEGGGHPGIPDISVLRRAGFALWSRERMKKIYRLGSLNASYGV